MTDLKFSANRIIPVVIINNKEDTVPTLNALQEGGIKVAEITLRTDCALNAISIGRKTFPNMIIGAGTVINSNQCKEAINNGAQFIVSPGFSEDVAYVCREKNVLYVPGGVTPTEIMKILSVGLSIVKFFPASLYGGVKALKAFSSVFPNVKFLPTGGIDESNMNEYLSLQNVVAIGGSWMMKGTYEDIKKLSNIAINKAKEN